jgi:DNA-binding transcriptional MerR regulator
VQRSHFGHDEEERMRIAELSRQSGVPVPTIKYYVREGLLAPGELTSPNQAQYDDSHLRRLKLIRALVDVGRLSIAATRDVLDTIDSPGLSLHETLGQAQRAVTPRPSRDRDGDSWQAASRQVDELISRRGWQVKETHPARQLLAELVVTLHSLGLDDFVDLLDDYADAAERVAAADVNTVLRRRDVDTILEGVVVGTVLGDKLFASLRRLAQADVSARTASEVAPDRVDL